MVDQMDTNMDTPSFDLQATFVSFEERRWLSKQRRDQQLDKLVLEITRLHKTVRGWQQFSSVPPTLTSLTMIPKKTVDDRHQLYYTRSQTDGCTDDQIDQFRLYHQQFFRSTFADTFNDSNYYLFAVLLEGTIFYASQTSKEYTSAMTDEMRKCLESFHSFVRRRVSKLIDFLSFLSSSTLSSYTIVHTAQRQNVGILFQLCPKVPYQLTPSTLYNSLLAIDEYAAHTISPEELRYLDYSMNMKQPRCVRSVPLATFGYSSVPLFIPSQRAAAATGTIPVFPLSNQILHSLPIVYPYTEEMIYHQKYPSFWTGDAHLNENNDVLFSSIPLDKASMEFTFVERFFHQTVSDTHASLVAIERVQNPHLWEKFSVHRSYMRRKNGRDHLNENWLFHGTNSDNHHRILAHGFNRSYCRDNVYYGRGVYFSRYACYSSHYGDRDDLSFLFLCRVLVGHHKLGSNDIRVPPTLDLPNGKSVQADSTTDAKVPYTIVCTFHDDQNYPEYIITYVNKTRLS